MDNEFTGKEGACNTLDNVIDVGKHVNPNWEGNIEPSRVVNSAEADTDTKTKTEIENRFRDQLWRL